MVKKKMPFLSLCLLLATQQAQLAAQPTAQPTMDQLIGVNVMPGIHARYLRQFSFLREFHEWGNDTGYDETDCEVNPLDPNNPCPLPPQIDWNASTGGNCELHKRYGWNPSQNASVYVRYDDLYRTFSRRFLPSLKSIVPNLRGLGNYPTFFPQINEEKPVCLNGAYTYNQAAPAVPQQSIYPDFASDQINAPAYRNYAAWATMFAARFGIAQAGPLINNFYLPRLLGNDPDPSGLPCDVCHRQVEPPNFNRGDIRFIEIWNEQDQTWTDGTAITLNATPTATPQFTRTFFYPAQYAAMLSAAYDGYLSTLQMNGVNLGVKNVDIGMNVVFGGTAGLRLNYVRDVMIWCNTFRANAPAGRILPFDVVNFHHYSSTGSQSQENEFTAHNTVQFGGGEGRSPEDDNLKGRLSALLDGLFQAADDLDLLDSEFSTKARWLSEFGYDSEEPQGGSGILVPDNISAADREKVQAQWLTRSFLEISAARSIENLLPGQYYQRAMVHTLQDPTLGPGVASRQFDFSGLIRSEGTPKRSWFYVLTMRNILTQRRFRAEGGLTVDPAAVPGNPPVRIYRYSKGTGSDISPDDVFAIWSPTANGTSFLADIMLPGPPNIPEQITTATLYKIKEFETNGQRIHKTNNGTFTNVTISETPIFVKLGEYLDEPSVQPVNNLTLASQCCGGVLLSWETSTTYKQYVVYYGRKDQLDAPVSVNGVLQFADFFQDIFGDPDLHFYNVEIGGGAKSVMINGLEQNVDYWFFLVPYGNHFNTPSFVPAIITQHFIGGMPQGCAVGPNNFCITPVQFNQLVFDQQTCPNNVAIFNDVFGITNTPGSGCEKVNHVPFDQGWFYAQGNHAACNQVILDFQAQGGLPHIIRTLYVRSNGSNGRLRVEYELCSCPGLFLPAPVITLPVAGGSVLYAYDLFPQIPIRRLRFTRLDKGTIVQRIFLCSKSSVCMPGLTDTTSPPLNVEVEDISATSALATWDQARMDANDLSSAPVGRYVLSYGTNLTEQGEILNPAEVEYEAEAGVENQIYRISELAPSTTYYLTIRTDFEDSPCPTPTVSPPSTFTTGSDGSRSSGNNAPSERHSQRKNGLSILPNPNAGTFDVLFPAAGVERIEIFDLSGRLIAWRKIPATATRYHLDDLEISAGVYLVKVAGSTLTAIQPELMVVK